MKINLKEFSGHLTLITLLSILLRVGPAAAQSAVSAALQAPSPTPFNVIERGANYRVWQQTNYAILPDGTVFPQVHKYTEVASGLCYHDVTTGQFADSSEEIDILPDGGGAAIHGQHKVYFPADIYSGAIEIVTPEGKILQERPVGVSYDDGRKTVWIAKLKHSAGQLVGTNQIIYPDAFTGFKADLVCTYRRSGFECDLIFREQPPHPKIYGLDADGAALQLVTEFFNSPEPETQSMAVRDGMDAGLRFGSLTMTHGRAFLVGTGASTNKTWSGKSVLKTWTHLQNRQLLIEQLPFADIQADLHTLPVSSAGTSGKVRGDSPLYVVSARRQLPELRQPVAGTNSIRLASGDRLKQRGFALDYNAIVANQTNFTFQSDTTYYVNGEYSLLRTNIVEGGTVIKFGSAGKIDINGTLVCNTGPYRAGIFTSVNDNSVGEVITGSTGTPAPGDVGTFLSINATNVTLNDLRFSYASTAVVQNPAAATLDVWDCQFAYDINAITADELGLHNVLFAGIGSYFTPQVYFTGANLLGENVTADGNFAFIDAESPGSSVTLVNCLVTGQPLISPYDYSVSLTTNSTVCLPSPSVPVYRVVGAGAYYLTNSSPYHNAGTTNITGSLLAYLAEKTTYPPIVYSNASFSLPVTLSPQAVRDASGNPDLGYHYDAIDYLLGGCDLYTNLTLTAGTDLAWYDDDGSKYVVYGQPYGLSLNDGANLTATGLASAPCWFARYDLVQEGVHGLRGWMGGMMINAGGGPLIPQVNFKFAKCATINSVGNLLRDAWTAGVCRFNDTEFYTGIGLYRASSYYTNCLFVRAGDSFLPPFDGTSFAFDNCTFWLGNLTVARQADLAPSQWTIVNTVFNGTTFNFTSDGRAGNPVYTYFDYNAFLSGSNLLETVGPHDLTNNVSFGWQPGWLGNFYLPPASPLIDAGISLPGLLRLDTFTTQTNQVMEGITPLDMGYHYAALSPLDFPIDDNGDGMADSWELSYFWYLNINPDGDAENDGLTNLQKYQQGLNPTVDYSTVSGSRLNYGYDADGWLNTVSGIQGGSITPDSQGNIQTVSQ